MPKKPPSLTFPPESITSLQQIHTTLTLLTARNKNQHRLTKWWASLGMLRRHLRNITNSFDEIERVKGEKALNWDEKKEKRVVVEERIRQEAVFLKDVLAEKCYLAFTSLIADTQFSALGLLLLGILAQVSKLLVPLCPTPPPIALSPLPPATPTKEEEQAIQSTVSILQHLPGGVEFDFGEKIARDVGMMERGRTMGEADESVVVQREQVSSKETTENKRKKDRKSEKRQKPIFEDEEERRGEEYVAANEGSSVTQKRGAAERGKRRLSVDSDGLVYTTTRSGSMDVEVEAKEVEKPKKKKKKRKGDAFDDLFSGLL